MAEFRALQSPLTEGQCEAILFRHFPGFTFTEYRGTHRQWCWEYGYDISNGVTRKFACRLCIQQQNRKIEAFAFQGLQNALSHLFEDHKIRAPPGKLKSKAEIEADTKKLKLKANKGSILHHFKLNPEDPTEQRLANALLKGFDKQHFQRLLVEWIVDSNLPFAAAHNQRLRRIFEYLNPSVRTQDAHLVASTIKIRAVSQFQQHKQAVIDVLRKSPGLIHLAFDGWRAPNRLSMYGVACFFRNEDNRPSKIILGIPEIGRHLGVVIADHVQAILDEFEIPEDKLGYAVLDNASNNDSAMKQLGDNLGFEGKLRRCRCIGHTINLSAKSLLFGHDSDAFEQQLSGADPLSRDEYTLWRSKGPVGKLHNLVVDIDRSDRRVLYEKNYYQLLTTVM